MTSTEAMIYCLGFLDEEIQDGEQHSQTAYDVNGEPHWFAWANGHPKLCSESPTPFAKHLEPYSM